MAAMIFQLGFQQRERHKFQQNLRACHCQRQQPALVGGVALGEAGDMNHGNLPGEIVVHQIWNPCSGFEKNFSIQAVDAKGDVIQAARKEGFHSPTYGVLEKTHQIIFSTSSNMIITTITSL